MSTPSFESHRRACSYIFSSQLMILSRVKWDNFRNSTQKMRIYGSYNFRIYYFQCRIASTKSAKTFLCLLFILFVTSNHQTTNLVFSNFFHAFFLSSEEIRKKMNFSTAQAEKNLWKKLGKTGLMSRTRYLRQPPRKKQKNCIIIKSHFLIKYIMKKVLSWLVQFFSISIRYVIMSSSSQFFLRKNKIPVF